MKRILIILLFGLTALFLLQSQADAQTQGGSLTPNGYKGSNISNIEIDSAELFYESGKSIHAIAFNNKGLMYFGGKLDVFTVTPEKSVKHFITLEEASSNTIIWSMIFGKDNNLYIAANDRIVEVTPERKQRVVIKEDFPGPCGISDLRFDQQGNLYVVYDNVVAKYDDSFRKTILIDGSKLSPPIQWAVGMEFSKEERFLYLGDCSGSNAYVFYFAGKDSLQICDIIKTNAGQYFAKDKIGNIYLTMPASNNTSPEFLLFKDNLTTMEVYCKEKPFQNEENFKKTIAIGKTGYDENAIYCIIGNKIFVYK